MIAPKGVRSGSELLVGVQHSEDVAAIVSSRNQFRDDCDKGKRYEVLRSEMTKASGGRTGRRGSQEREESRQVK